MEETRTNEPSIDEVRAHMKEDFAQLREVADRRREAVMSEVRRFVDENPIAAVGAAFGLGYVLSGALLSRTTLRFLAIGARLYGGRLVRELLMAEGPPAGGMTGEQV